MVSEVQYGGKITDDLDRRMFKTYTQVQHPKASTPVYILPGNFAREIILVDAGSLPPLPCMKCCVADESVFFHSVPCQQS